MIPARHALCALMLEYSAIIEDESKKLAYLKIVEIEYKRDLGEGVKITIAHPNNIWSLKGLYNC
jgi:hypothetical protein